MKKIHIILIVLLGLFLMPSATFACGGNSKKDSCNKNSSTNTEQMDCCKSGNHSKSDKHNGCKGKCGHSNCVTISLQYSVVFFEMQFKNNNFAFSEKKQNYFISNNNLSTGFYSLWLIPKIS